MNTLLRRIVLLLLLFTPAFVSALQKPKCMKEDSRICTFDYQENQVYQIVGFVGYPTVIVFGEKEVVELPRLFSGYKDAWEFTTPSEPGMSNRLGIKARGKLRDDARTSLFVTTNERLYIFELTTSSQDGVAQSPQSPREQGMAWLIRFQYPMRVAPQSAAPELGKREFNFRYQACGNTKEFPYLVWDDGKFTHFWFYREQGLPAFFVVDSDGRERVVHPHTEGDVRIVHQLSEEFRLRAGGSVVCVKRIDPLTRSLSR